MEPRRTGNSALTVIGGVRPDSFNLWLKLFQKQMCRSEQKRTSLTRGLAGSRYIANVDQRR
jgi:hypothetical protein